MQPYRDTSSQSGVAAYEDGPGYLKVRFRSGDTYLYDRRHPGPRRLARMKALAASGRGLATYIAQEVRDDYAEKISPG
jgi:hypothetical protein